MKPAIFIGSSVEGLPIARAIQDDLQPYDAECTVWNQGVFTLSTATLNALIKESKEVDYAIFVFSPDDVTVMREQTHNTIRDNVLFECGLFMGALGIENVFFVHPINTPIHIPTDLLGIAGGIYDPNRNDKKLQAALGPFCTQVRERIKSFNYRDQERDIINAADVFPGQWRNEWFEGTRKLGEETFSIENKNQYCVEGKALFTIENLKVNERKNYLKLTRIGTSSDESRNLSATLSPLYLVTGEREGMQSDKKTLKLTQIR